MRYPYTPRPRLALIWALTTSAISLAPEANARLYSYVNEEGDYVVSQKKPKNVDEYAVLTDEGEFIRLVKRKRDDVPITHWRPWYMPNEPDPINPVEPGLEQRTPEVLIEEVDEPEPN